MDSPMPSISANADTSFGDRSNIFDQSIGEDDNAALLDMPTPTKIFDDDDAQPTMLQNHDDKKNIAEDRNYTGHGKGRKRPFSQIEDDTVDDDSPRGKELATLRTLNNAVKAITANMEQARGNLKQFTATVDQTDDLLNLWINILSQSEHTKRLLENAQWQGGIVDIAISRQIAAQKEREREQRELQLRLADEEKRRREDVVVDRARKVQEAEVQP
ncbi:hypothetical protein BZG36_01770 [Bifiguratus adelaidae]|uniref:DASH complex subunit DUO1 n=1 Tax=Bifiguratus adelaidae TaxID=1938954 RepID=A0A261Y2Z5_9FUNG|nr:hypothetical protein BZG36_01770 [Bifiguratus adelaidae]